MADPVSIIFTTITMVRKAIEISKEVSANKESCLLLGDRLQALDPALLALLRNPSDKEKEMAFAIQQTIDSATSLMERCKSSAATDLLALTNKPANRTTLKKATTFMKRLGDQILHRKDIADQFLDINSRITQHLQDLSVLKLYQIEEAVASQRTAMEAILKDYLDVIVQAGNNVHSAILQGAPLPENLSDLTKASTAFHDDMTEIVHKHQPLISNDKKLLEEIATTSSHLEHFLTGQVQEMIRASQAFQPPLALPAFPLSWDQDILHDFEGETVLGQPGTFGVTYKRRYRPHKNMFYAVKAIQLPMARRHGVSEERLVQEATILKSIQHHHIVECLHAFFSEDHLYFHIVMEYIDGVTLFEKIGQPIGREVLLKWSKQILSALLFIHSELNLIHRDLKPQNVMITKGMEDVKLIDFGLARSLAGNGIGVGAEQNMTQGVGTSLYASPEKLTSSYYDDRDDIWAVGCMLVELLLQDHLTGGYLRNAGDDKRHSLLGRCQVMDKALTTLLIEKMVVIKMQDRYRACDCLLAIDAIASGPQESLPPPSSTIRNSPPSIELTTITTTNSGSGKGSGKGRTTEEMKKELSEGLHDLLGETAAIEDVEGYVCALWKEGIRRLSELADELQGEEADLYLQCIDNKRHQKTIKAKLTVTAEKKAAGGTSNSNSSSGSGNDDEALAEYFAAAERHYLSARLGKKEDLDWLEAEKSQPAAAAYLACLKGFGDYAKQGKDEAEAEELSKAVTVYLMTKQLSPSPLTRRQVFFLLGQFSLIGIGNNGMGDEKAAFEFFLKAVDLGSASALVRLGYCYYHGKGTVLNYGLAVSCFKRGCEEGVLSSFYSLSQCYKLGLGVPQDYKEALSLCRYAAEQGHGYAQHSLAQFYKQGEGVAVDYKEAVEWFVKAAQQGVVEAQYSLAMCYKKGEGVAKNLDTAALWCRKAAQHGYANAQYSLGLCYKNGEGVQQSFQQAAVWFTKAAEQGNIYAQHSLGLSYKNGQGVNQDDTEAVEWYRKAAEQGYAPAQYSLGLCFKGENGGVADYAEAVVWFTKAANQGHAAAQYSLGLRYQLGQGVVKSVDQAMEWYKKAADQGDEKAKEALKKLTERK
eukprot:gene11030-12280_t